MSPLLFSLFLNDLEDYLKSHYNGIRVQDPKSLEVYLHLFVLLYADDTIILAESASELQKALDVL